MVKLSRCLTPGNGEIMEGTKRGVGGEPWYSNIVRIQQGQYSTVRYSSGVSAMSLGVESH